MPISERECLVKLATEYWRLLRLLERTVNDGPPEKMAKGDAQLRYAGQRLQALLAEVGVRLVTYENQPFEPNMPVTVRNADEALDFESPIVDRTLEPTIICDSQVIAMGQVSIKNRT